MTFLPRWVTMFPCWPRRTLRWARSPRVTEVRADPSRKNGSFLVIPDTSRSFLVSIPYFSFVAPCATVVSAVHTFYSSPFVHIFLLNNLKIWVVVNVKKCVKLSRSALNFLGGVILMQQQSVHKSFTISSTKRTRINYRSCDAIYLVLWGGFPWI